jgi:hypothetical protein
MTFLRAADVFLSGAVTSRGHNSRGQKRVIRNELNMYRISTSWLGLGCLVAVSCGAPAELDESRFPGVDDTGYTDGTAGAGTGGAGVVPSGGAGTTPSGGAGTVPSGGAGGAAAGSGGAGVAQQGGSAGTPAAGGTGAVAGGCPDDITLLFNRPIEQGGCAGSLCHIPGVTAPDLVSPNPEQRLVNQQSSGACGSRPYISPTESLLAEKIAGNPPPCGLAMPFLMPAALSADDEACILAWIDQVSGG